MGKKKSFANTVRFFAAAALTCQLATAQAADVVIGQVTPLTGPLVSTGQQLVLGAKIYFDWINSKGGVHGAHIKQLVADDGYKPEEPVRLTREQLARPEAVALTGNVGTANVTRLLTEKVLEEGRVPLVGPYTGAEALRSPFNPWIFHVRASYADEAEHMVRQLTTLGMQRIAVLYQDDGFGKSALDAVIAALQRCNLKMAASAGYERNTEKVEVAVAAIKAVDAQAVIMVANNRPAAAFIKRYREAGGSAHLYNISVIDAAEVASIVGLKNAHGLGISQVVPSPYLPTRALERGHFRESRQSRLQVASAPPPSKSTST